MTSSNLPVVSLRNTGADRTRELPICFIPARKGSKRVKDKNKRMLNGKPLFLYAVEAAKESGVFGVIAVSSNDTEILEMAYKCRVYPHKRPTALARDNVSLLKLARFLISVFRAEEFAILSPCNPFRTGEDIKEAYKLFKEKEANFLVSVVKCSHPPQVALEIKQNYLRPYWGNECIKQRQELKPLYMPDGSIIFGKGRKFLEQGELGWYGEKSIPFIMEKTVDIDTEDEFAYAKFLLENNKC